MLIFLKTALIRPLANCKEFFFESFIDSFTAAEDGTFFINRS